MIIEDWNDHRYLYFAAKCSCFLANFYKALIFWFFCLDAKEQTEKEISMIRRQRLIIPQKV
jgi:hypothetical protein